MTLETFYFIAEIVAALAVVVSLLIVAYQLREGNRTSHIARHYEISEATLKAFEPICSGENAKIFRRGLAGDPDLTGDERFVFGLFMARLMTVAGYLLNSVDFAFLSDDDANQWAIPLYQSIAQSPGGREWIRENSHMTGTKDLAAALGVDLSTDDEMTAK